MNADVRMSIISNRIAGPLKPFLPCVKILLLVQGLLLSAAAIAWSRGVCLFDSNRSSSGYKLHSETETWRWQVKVAELLSPPPTFQNVKVYLKSEIEKTNKLLNDVETQLKTEKNSPKKATLLQALQSKLINKTNHYLRCEEILNDPMRNGKIKWSFQDYFYGYHNASFDLVYSCFKHARDSKEKIQLRQEYCNLVDQVIGTPITVQENLKKTTGLMPERHRKGGLDQEIQELQRALA